MSDNSIITGLDIGTTRIVEIIARVNADGGIGILGVGEEPCQGGFAVG